MKIEFSRVLATGQFTALKRYAPKLSSLTIIALMSWFLAHTTIALLAPSHANPTETANESLRAVNPRALTEASLLFGNWEEPAEDDKAAATEHLAETKLPLNLIGVFVSDVGQASGAIIASGQGPGKHYHVGDGIPGNAILESVQVDGVMIRRGTRLERLSFPQPASGQALLQEATADHSSESTENAARPPYDELHSNTSPSHLEASSLSDKIEEYQALAVNNPDEALNQLGLKPIEASGAQGYQVGTLPDNEWIRQSGLQDGDILLSVNGRPVGNPDLDRLEIDNLFAEGQVRLEIQRGERRFFVSAKLSP